MGNIVILLPCRWTCTYAGVGDFVPRESVTASSTGIIIMILTRVYVILDLTNILRNISHNFIYIHRAFMVNYLREKMGCKLDISITAEKVGLTL